jgi:uncharacterized protein (DUF58 family)
VPFPTRRLAAVAALASVILIVVGEPISFWIVNAALVVAASVDALLARPSVVHVDRTTPDVVTLGVEGTVTWHIENRSSRRVHTAVADDLAPSLHAGTRRMKVRLRPHATAEVATTFVPSRRGRFEVTRLVVRIEGPLGLAARQRTIAQPDVIRVYPPFRSRDEAELRINRARILEVGLRSAQGRGGGTEFDQLREYTVDDEFRRIDWAATARTGRAIVRTYRAERNQTVICLLDNGRVMAGRVDGVPRVEYAMDAVMTVTTVATRLGDRAGLVAFDRTVRAVVPPAQARTHLGLVTEAMYQLEPALAESDYRGAFTETLARFRRRTMLVILTDLVEQAVGESLLPALPLIMRSHVVIVACVQDPEVVQWASMNVENAADAYRQAAAMSTLEERHRTAARLRGLGATVIDDAPGRMAARLADAYLEVKATGAL